jgi:hypothetical protein
VSQAGVYTGSILKADCHKTGLIPLCPLNGTYQFGFCCFTHLVAVLFGDLLDLVDFHARFLLLAEMFWVVKK